MATVTEINERAVNKIGDLVDGAKDFDQTLKDICLLYTSPSPRDS